MILGLLALCVGLRQWDSPEDAAGSEFGRDRLAAVVRARRDESAESIAAVVHETVDAFRGPGPRGDDATVIVARVPHGIFTADH